MDGWMDENLYDVFLSEKEKITMWFPTASQNQAVWYKVEQISQSFLI